MDVQAATKSDIPAIMRVERTDGYARLVGRWEAEHHASEIENPACRYLVARDGPTLPALPYYKAWEAPIIASGSGA